jgi:hypothetical protein
VSTGCVVRRGWSVRRDLSVEETVVGYLAVGTPEQLSATHRRVVVRRGWSVRRDLSVEETVVGYLAVGTPEQLSATHRRVVLTAVALLSIDSIRWQRRAPAREATARCVASMVDMGHIEAARQLAAAEACPCSAVRAASPCARPGQREGGPSRGVLVRGRAGGGHNACRVLVSGSFQTSAANRSESVAVEGGPDDVGGRLRARSPGGYWNAACLGGELALEEFPLGNTRLIAFRLDDFLEAQSKEMIAAVAAYLRHRGQSVKASGDLGVLVPRCHDRPSDEHHTRPGAGQPAAWLCRRLRRKQFSLCFRCARERLRIRSRSRVSSDHQVSPGASAAGRPAGRTRDGSRRSRGLPTAASRWWSVTTLEWPRPGRTYRRPRVHRLTVSWPRAMSTVNPVVVTTAAAATRVEEIAEGFVGSFTLGSGQFCTKPGLLFAPVGAAAADAIGMALKQASPEPVMLTEAIAKSTARGLEELSSAGAHVVGRVEAFVARWCAPAAVLEAPIDALQDGSRLLEECFGAVALVVEYSDLAEVAAAVDRLQGSLAASVFTADQDDPDAAACLALLSPKVGRLCANDWPTGVAYTWAQQHGGPWPATSAPSATLVGAAALDRFVRPVTYQSLSDEWLPPAPQAANPWSLSRRVNGVLQPPGGDGVG